MQFQRLLVHHRTLPLAIVNINEDWRCYYADEIRSYTLKRGFVLGPIALIDEKMPVIVIATNKSAYDKIASNIQEVKARKGMVVALVTDAFQLSACSLSHNNYPRASCSVV